MEGWFPVGDFKIELEVYTGHTLIMCGARLNLFMDNTTAVLPFPMSKLTKVPVNAVRGMPDWIKYGYFQMQPAMRHGHLGTKVCEIGYVTHVRCDYCLVFSVYR